MTASNADQMTQEFLRHGDSPPEAGKTTLRLARRSHPQPARPSEAEPR